MHFKIDKNLQLIADEVNATPEYISVSLCNYLIGAAILDDDWRSYGKPFNQVTGSILVENIARAFSMFLYDVDSAIPAKVFSALCELKIMGDGNCPDCGGDLELTDTEHVEYRCGDGYTTPLYETEITGYIYLCDCCGRKYKFDEEL